VESFNGKIRDELLAIEEFATLKYQTPDQFTLEWQNNNPGLRKILAH
jgi:hypothetical protein